MSAMRIPSRRPKIVRRCLTAAVACCLFAGTLAQPATSFANDIEKAQALYAEGVEAIRDDRPADGARLFRQSYALAPKPELLYNEAVAWARAGEIERALEIAQGTEIEGLPDSLKVRNEARISGWHSTLLARRSNHTVANERAERAIAAAQPQIQMAATPPPTAPEEGWKTGQIVGLSVTAVGAGALIGAGITEVLLQSKLDEADTAASKGAASTHRAAIDDALTLQQVERVLLISGAVLVVGGLITWLVWPDAEDSAPQALTWRF